MLTIRLERTPMPPLASRPIAVVCVLAMLVTPANASAQAAASVPKQQDQSSPPSSKPQPDQQQLAQDVQQKTQDIQNDIRTRCGYDPKERDPKKIKKTNTCIEKLIRIHRQSVRLEESLQNTAQAEAVTEKRGELVQTEANNNHLMQFSEISEVPASPPPQTTPGAGPPQPFAGGSLSGTLSTCGSGSGFNSALIRVHRVVMPPQIASDDFGYRLGRRFVVYQVTVENGSKDMQFMLQDVTVDFSHVFGQNPGMYSYNASGQDLSLLRGVPEKGEDLDPRNLLLHVLQGIGSVAGAVSGLTSVSAVMGPSVAVFNGSFLQGYTTIAPDHTSTQLNRLSDSAFIANTIVDKQRAKTIAMFIPADEVLSRDEQNDFRNDPHAFVGFEDLPGILTRADVCVDGTFIQPVNLAAPTLTSAVLPNSPPPAGNLDTTIQVTGTNIVSADTMVTIGTGNTATNTLLTTTDGRTGTAQVHLPSDYNTGSTSAMLQSKTNPSLTSSSVKITIAAANAPVMQPNAPTLTSAVLAQGATAGSNSKITIIGTNLSSTDTIVLLGTGANATNAQITTSDGKNGTAQIKVPTDYVAGTTTAALQSKSNTSLTSSAVKVTVASQ
jgi:hypothetical protein